MAKEILGSQFHFPVLTVRAELSFDPELHEVSSILILYFYFSPISIGESWKWEDEASLQRIVQPQIN
jgi:hypothetical protein